MRSSLHTLLAVYLEGVVLLSSDNIVPLKFECTLLEKKKHLPNECNGIRETPVPVNCGLT